MAGRLAEILGSEVLASDRWHRTMGFPGISSAVLASIPDDQRKVLESYSEGVNRAMADFEAGRRLMLSWRTPKATSHGP